MRASLVASRGLRGVNAKFRHLFLLGEWAIGILRQPLEAIVTGLPREIVWLPREKGVRYETDPFLVERDGQVYIFYERLSIGSRRGAIWVAILSEGLELLERRPVLSERYHLSYPFILDYEGRYYGLPEAQQSGRTVLYEIVDFPFGWQPFATLTRDVALLDPTILHHDGLWWLFGTQAGSDPKSRYSELQLWFSRELKGPWEPHPANPVKSDVASSRPAGTPFIREGRLYRPGQDCSRRYGEAVVLNEITELSQVAFEERPIRRVEPAQEGTWAERLHTVSGTPRLTAIDGYAARYTANPSVVTANLGAGLREYISLRMARDRRRRA